MVDLSNFIQPNLSKTWRFPSFLAKNKQLQETIQKTWKEYSTTNSSNSDDPKLFWEAGKAVLHGRIIAFTAGYIKNVTKQYSEASAALRSAHNQLAQNNSPEHRKTWREAKVLFDHWAVAQEKLHKLLANLSRGYLPLTHIPAMKNTQGKLTYIPKDINQILENKSTNLYSPDPIDRDQAQDFLDQVPLPKLDQAFLKQINTPITLSEVTTAISTLANGKAPGPDGFTSEFYKMASDTISSTLLSVFETIADGGQYLRSGFQTHIKLIPKKGKDPTELGSYHPISLLNLDSKLLSKMYAQRLALMMPKLIHPSQVGFIKGCSATANIRKGPYSS